MSNRDHYFAVDMMRYLANKYNLDWVPSEDSDPTSPFTNLMKRCIDAYLDKCDKKILEQSEWVLSQCRGNERLLRRILYEGFDEDELIAGNEGRFFEIITGVTRIGTLISIGGIRCAPDVTIEVIEHFLRRFQHQTDVDLYPHFNRHCMEATAISNK